MDWSEQLSNINYWAVILAALSSFALGSAWYSMKAFGAMWLKHVGLTLKQAENQDGMMTVYGATAAGSFIAAAVLAVLMMATQTDGVLQGAIFGFLVGFAFRFTSHAMHNGFAKRSYELTMIDSMHDMVQLAIMGAIIGGMN